MRGSSIQWDPRVSEFVGLGGGGVFIRKEEDNNVCMATGTHSFPILAAIRHADEYGMG